MNDITYYWELSTSDRAAQGPHIHAEECYLAADINLGRALLEVQYGDWREAPDLIGGPAIDEEEDLECAVADRVASLLHAAAYAGLDPLEICRHALQLREAIEEDAVKAVKGRERAYRESRQQPS